MVKEKIRAELVVFDLDGTLIDSSLDIAWSANETLKAFGHPPRDLDAIVESIGWGVKTLLEKLMPGEGPDVIGRARERFLEFYGGHLTVDTSVYPGVRETVERLGALGKKMAVVTNKPEGLARRVLKDLSLDGYFLMVLGGDSLPERKPDPAPLLKVMAGLGAQASRTVMVGDSPIDCEAGRKAGALTIAVTYGFRGAGELEQAGCHAMIGSLPELMELIA